MTISGAFKRKARKENLHMLKIAQIAPYGQKRNAPDSIYPLRGFDGRTWSERGGFVTQAMINKHGSYAAARAAISVFMKGVS